MKESLANNETLSQAMLNDISDWSDDASFIVSEVASSFSNEFDDSPVPLFFPGINAEPRADWLENEDESMGPMMYPNPANEFIVLNWQKTGTKISEVLLVDVMGNKVREIQMQENQCEILVLLKEFSPGSTQQFYSMSSELWSLTCPLSNNENHSFCLHNGNPTYWAASSCTIYLFQFYL